MSEGPSKIQILIWSSIQKDHPNTQLSKRRQLVLRLTEETNIDLFAVATYFQFYEAHLLKSIFTEGYVSLDSLGILELFVSEEEKQIYFHLQNSEFLRTTIDQLKTDFPDCNSIE